MIQIKHFENQKEQLKWLYENRNSLIDQRKSESKKSDTFSFMSYAVDTKGERLKSNAIIDPQANTLKVRCIINTTGLLDTHTDVHIPGIWKKSLSESKLFYLCKEHDLSFQGIITEEIEAYTKKYVWKDLGLDLEGETEALVFDSTIEKERNKYMFQQYQKGYVRNHSVRMQYMKQHFCINSDAYPDQLDNWNKYIKYVANIEDAEAKNYFWAVTEAKIIEGSAVVKGSNWATPTLEVNDSSKAMNMSSKPKKNKDIEFIDMMIPHHEMAIKMANKFKDKVKNTDLKKIISNILKSQADEIEKMKKIKENIQADKSLDTTEPPEGTQNEKKEEFINFNI